MRRNASGSRGVMNHVVTGAYIFIFAAVLFLILLYASSIGSRRVDDFRDEMGTSNTIHAVTISVDIYNTVPYDGVE